VHNLVFGQMYLDLGDKMIVRNLRTREYCIIEYTRRGWATREESQYLLEGLVYTSAPEQQKQKDILPNQHFPTKGGTLKYKLVGNWNKQISIVGVDERGNNIGDGEVYWTKNPYPEKFDWMYGMTKYAINLNYFPP